ncbi:MAG: UDP-N-acetylmuramoyl-L-alanyl-D-glutamate--2,6-diaminopimelate ligase, partial [Candidatus Shapirobacteria bacterium]|nr:UDP-N-acetylmuramoyl-L-alanyl-D-glutamate--2,6-diaminopimelate ligase [Candidatus Shapirobacteria bacterium]
MLRQIKNFYHLLTAIFFTFFYRFPARKLTVIGVTGTDGKTTTTNLIYHILKESGKKVSMISSVNAVIGEKAYKIGFHVTTPVSRDIQKFLYQAVLAGSEYFVLESSSHGLSQNRLFGCFFHVGVVTNIIHDHFDYHKNYNNYLEAKGKLFDRVKIAVLNCDDKSYSYLNAKCKAHSIKCVTYGIKGKADFTLDNFQFETSLPGEYNQYNCLAAVAVTSNLGIPEEQIKKALASFKGIKGRMDEIKSGQNFKVFIDFASTPNSLKNALQTLSIQKVKGARLIVVFGSAGLRDKIKRGMMGEISGEHADISIITAEDPRTEDVNQIIEEICQGCFKVGAKEIPSARFDDTYHQSKGPYFIRIPDREEAIKFAIQKIAKKDDIIVTCGKGHESSMCYGKIEK